MKLRHPVLFGLTTVMLSGSIASGPMLGDAPVASPPVLFRDDMSYANGLITNEFAYFNPTNPAAMKSPNWEMTSGSLFANNRAGWTGIPDTSPVDARSSRGNNSAVFRLTSVRKDFKQVLVSFLLWNEGLSTTATTPAVTNDGVHFFLRYQTEYHIYYASVNRRDNTVIIKKKMPGGPSNGGTYYNLSPYMPYQVPYRTWQNVAASIKDNSDGSVTIELFANGNLLVSATDRGTGGPPITDPGAVGIRADNDNISFKNFVVTSLDSNTPPSNSRNPTALGGLVSLSVHPVPWRHDRDNGAPITFEGVSPGATVRIFTVAGQSVVTLAADGTSIAWPLKNDEGQDVASGVYVYLASDGQGEKKKGLLAVVR